MKLKICNGLYDDFLTVEGSNQEEIRKQIRIEISKKNWKDKDCRVEEVK